MPFINLPGFSGKIYVPAQESSSLKKHSCCNCFSCQMCSDDRCSICLSNPTGEKPDSEE
ncbi:MAG: hypothetical protein JRE21_09500 [Deltaproteobacteria bacterium]|nr:hypothetical protein [Deltaproteobacteria bacterium]